MVSGDRAVHPRGCGEYFTNSAFTFSIDGSSPRMRGIRQQPASRHRSRAVHPRGCGEYRIPNETVCARRGSSPRMRGIQPQQDLRQHQARFIPADAGNTRNPRSRGLQPTVHPRGCGEYLACRCLRPATGGSSPRMRGILTREPEIFHLVRFIPADAGNTSRAACMALYQSVHPRGCGEYVQPCAPARYWVGSSPRMRGIRTFQHGARRQRRFIPADAGNTHPLRQQDSGPPVHPRGCGEYCCASRSQSRSVGSSPRMRGIRLPSIGLSLASRFIPADAGNTKPEGGER